MTEKKLMFINRVQTFTNAVSGGAAAAAVSLLIKDGVFVKVFPTSAYFLFLFAASVYFLASLFLIELTD